MTDQERQLLEELAGRIQKAPAPQVDREADELIRRGIGARPDALYILTQTVLIQEMALNQAKQQIDELKRQQPQGSFLGNNSPAGGTAWGGGSERSAPASGYRASSYQSGYVPPAPSRPEPPPLPPQSANVQGYPEQPQSRFSSFLHNAAQTAAGVVAGEVAFSAISSLFGHHGGGVYGGSGFLGGGGGSFVSPGSETIINNYYEEGGRGEHGGRQTDFASDDGSDDGRDNSLVDDVGNSDTDDDLTDNVSDDFDDGSSYDDGSDSVDV